MFGFIKDNNSNLYIRHKLKDVLEIELVYKNIEENRQNSFIWTSGYTHFKKLDLIVCFSTYILLVWVYGKIQWKNRRYGLRNDVEDKLINNNITGVVELLLLNGLQK